MNKYFVIKKLVRVFLLNTILCLWSTHLIAGMKNEPLVAGVFFDELAVRTTDKDNNQGNALVLDMQAWLGKDLNKLWFKMDAERVDGELEQAELHALHSRAISTYWDLQLGVRKDFKPEPNRSWAVLGVKGLAPYFFEIDSAFFIGEEGQAAFRFESEYDMRFTQKLILSPSFSANAYAKDDVKFGLGKGLSDSEIALRLRYEIWREFAPYMGIAAHNTYAGTADYLESFGEKPHTVQFMFGFRFWY